MIAILALAIALTIAALILGCIAAAPLYRTITNAIDCWADSVHGSESAQLDS